MLLAAIAALALARVAPLVHRHTPPPPSLIRSKQAVPRATVQREHAYVGATYAGATTAIGVTTLPLARNEWRAWGPSALASVDAFQRAADKHVRVIMWYADWAHNEPDLSQLRAVAARHAIPEITWEPWNSHRGLYAHQPSYTLASIIEGRHDAYIRRWARALASYGKPVRLRFGQEMNGDWYPWAEEANHNKPHQFVKAWRHVYRIFGGVGATNVQWVWSPVASGVKPEEYPGSAYVDVIGLSGFNGGPELRWRPWRTFQTIFGPALKIVHRIAPHKPIELSEIAVSEKGGPKAKWIANFFATLRRYPEVDSIVWFNVNKGSTWSIQSSPASERAFAAGAASPRYS